MRYIVKFVDGDFIAIDGKGYSFIAMGETDKFKKILKYVKIRREIKKEQEKNAI